MARLTEKDKKIRQKFVREYLENNPEITQKQVIDKLKAEGISSTYETVKQDMKFITQYDDNAIENMSEYKILEKSLKTLEAELNHNKKLRSKCKSESASSQYSRIIKDITCKIADISKDLLEMKILHAKKARPLYNLTIGTFPTAKVPTEY